MKWLLDTNVVSETVRPRPNRSVLAWFASQTPDLVAVSFVTMAELRVGIAATPDDRRRQELTEWFKEAFPGWLANRILPVTVEILTDWLVVGDALSRKRQTRNPADLLIAATARVHNLTLVTRNVRDFANTGVVVYDPWQNETHRTEHT